MKRSVVVGLSALVCAFFARNSVAATAPSAQDTMTITFVRSAAKGSADFNRVRTFLLAQASQVGSNSGNISDLMVDKLGRFTIRSVRYRSIPPKPVRDRESTVIPTDETSPGIGDTWSVSTCIGDLLQSWSWTYGEKGWMPTSYAMDSRSACPAAGSNVST